MQRSALAIAIIGIAGGVLSSGALAQTVGSAPAIPLSQPALRAALAPLEYDSSIPLNVSLLGTTRAASNTQERLAFSGWRTRVPAYLWIPNAAPRPMPVVILAHAGNSSKETFLRPDGPERGSRLLDGLLAAGFAVFAADLQGHGERTAYNDYLPLATLYFDRGWMRRFRDLAAESAVDLRRALDYLSTRTDFDTRRVAIVGYSMGGLTASIASAADARITATVLCVPAIMDTLVFPYRPLDLASAFAERSLLVLAGRSDELFPLGQTRAFVDAVPGNRHSLVLFDSGHQLPAAYVDSTVTWLRRTLR